MTNIKNRRGSKKKMIKAAIFVVTAMLVTTLGLGLGYQTKAQTYGNISASMGLGSRGTNVTNLQNFLATDDNIYPQGLVTGYFGSLTRDAVTQFQLAYDIDPVGRVGPITLSKINDVMDAGRGIDIYGPIISNISVQTTSNSATIGWTTNEMAQGAVFYGTSPISVGEAQMSFVSPAISGTPMPTGMSGTSQSVTLSSLSANTTYYYVIRATDPSGNVSIVSRGRMFTTGS